MRFTGGIDGVIEAVAKGHPCASGHQHLDKGRVVGQPFDLGHRQLWVLRGNVDRGAERWSLASQWSTVQSLKARQ